MTKQRDCKRCGKNKRNVSRKGAKARRIRSFLRAFARAFHVGSMTLFDLQRLIHDIYDAKDRKRGVEGTFMWFMEEVGELSAALRNGSREELMLEFADVLAWLATLANVVGVDLEEAVRKKYGSGCPGCGKTPCACDRAEKP